jgi:hypothetical protein
VPDVAVSAVVAGKGDEPLRPFWVFCLPVADCWQLNFGSVERDLGEWEKTGASNPSFEVQVTISLSEKV